MNLLGVILEQEQLEFMAKIKLSFYISTCFNAGVFLLKLKLKYNNEFIFIDKRSAIKCGVIKMLECEQGLNIFDVLKEKQVMKIAKNSIS